MHGKSRERDRLSSESGHPHPGSAVAGLLAPQLSGLIESFDMSRVGLGEAVARHGAATDEATVMSAPRRYTRLHSPLTKPYLQTRVEDHSITALCTDR
jgi:hypothetical protein